MLVLVISMDSIRMGQSSSPDYARNCKDLLLRLSSTDQAISTAPFHSRNSCASCKRTAFFIRILPAGPQVDTSFSY